MVKYDAVDIYCRRLGHYLPFKYCRTVNNGLPCHKIKDCSFEKIPVQEFLEENYSEEEIRLAFTPPGNKLSSIIDLINKAKDNG